MDIVLFLVYLITLFIILICAFIDDLCVKHSDDQIFIMYAQSETGTSNIGVSVEWKELEIKPQPKANFARDKKYRRWLHTRPCIINDCNCYGDVVGCHLYAGGMGTKCSDYDEISACYYHHQSDKGLDILGIKRFNELYGVDVEEKSKELYKEYLNGNN
jgi:hypothetical protein